MWRKGVAVKIVSDEQERPTILGTARGHTTLFSARIKFQAWIKIKLRGGGSPPCGHSSLMKRTMWWTVLCPAKVEYKNGRVKTRPYIIYLNNMSIQSAQSAPKLATCHSQLATKKALPKECFFQQNLAFASVIISLTFFARGLLSSLSCARGFLASPMSMP